MAQTTTNLGKIHVFPSETLYNQFKDIIADNDLALLKDDGAYIVAALLEQNGYVKFSNGLILQWGTWKVGDSAWHPFPISFSKACYQIVCAININDSGNMSKNRVFVSSYDNNGFNIAAYGQGIRMIAIGV